MVSHALPGAIEGSASDSPKQVRSAHRGMLAWAITVGLSFPAVELLSEQLPPLSLTAVRFAVAAAATYLLTRRSEWSRPCGRGLALYAGLGLGLSGFFGTMFWAAQRSSPVSLATIYVSVPLLSYFLGRLFGVERRALALLGILILGAGGALGLAWAESRAVGADLRFGMAEAAFFLGCIASALYPVLSKWGLARGWLSHQAEVRSVWSLVAGAVIVATLALFFESPQQLLTMTTRDAAVLLYLGVFSSGMTFWLTQRATSVLTPAAITAYSYLVPFVSMLLLFLEDPHRIDWHWLPGSLSVLLAVALLLGRDVTAGSQAPGTPSGAARPAGNRADCLCDA